jgi:hypothetical protein
LEEEIVNEYDYVGQVSLLDAPDILPPARAQRACFRNVGPALYAGPGVMSINGAFSVGHDA